MMFWPDSTYLILGQYLVRCGGDSLGNSCSASSGFLLLDLDPGHWGRVQSIQEPHALHRCSDDTREQ